MLTYNLRANDTVAYTTATCDHCKVTYRINSGDTQYIRSRLRKSGWLAGSRIHLCPRCNKLNQNETENENETTT